MRNKRYNEIPNIRSELIRKSYIGGATVTLVDATGTPV